MKNKAFYPICGSNSKVMLKDTYMGLLGATERYILEYAEGSPLYLRSTRSGTVETEITELKLFGWAQQTKTNGYQVFDETKAEDGRYQKYDTNSDMTIVSASNYWISGIVELEPNTSYSSNMNLTGVFYTEDKQPIKSWIVYNAKTFRTPTNCRYVVFNFEKVLYPFKTKHELMLNKGSYVYPYEEYSNGLKSPSVEFPQHVNGAGTEQTLAVTINETQTEFEQKLYGLEVPENYQNITYVDEFGQAWVADELDLINGKLIKRVKASETEGISVLEEFETKTIDVSSLLNVQIPEGNIEIRNNGSAYMKCVYKASGG